MKCEERMFSLCGLACCLCPMRHISEENHCTGCGGKERSVCAIMRCAREHGNVEYCVQCDDYPCDRYPENPLDSFIPACHVTKDFAFMKMYGVDALMEIFQKKEIILRYLLTNFNDGRSKSFFCTAVNLLELECVEDVYHQLLKIDLCPNQKEKAKQARKLLQSAADQCGISLKLKKK